MPCIAMFVASHAGHPVPLELIPLCAQITFDNLTIFQMAVDVPFCHKSLLLPMCQCHSCGMNLYLASSVCMIVPSFFMPCFTWIGYSC